MGALLYKEERVERGTERLQKRGKGPVAHQLQLAFGTLIWNGCTWDLFLCAVEKVRFNSQCPRNIPPL